MLATVPNAASPLVAMVTLLALVLYVWMGIRVGSARGKFGISAPAVTGHPEFERHFRVQANTLENLPIFLVSMWLFAAFLDARIGAGLGLVWVVGRILYMMGYVEEPSKRSLGFGVQAVAGLALLLGALGAVAWRLAHGGMS